MKATLKENKEKIVSVSELNNGGVGKIFLDLQKNNSEYIILKNDRPAAVLLFNHMEKKARLKLPKVLSDIHYFFLPFFSNPFREDKAANTCYRDLWNDGTGETRWKRKKLSQRLRRSDAE